MTRPDTNLCDTGTANPVPVSGSDTGPWYWSCLGLNGGATADCSAQYQADLPVLRISGNNEIWHKSIQDACDAASNGDYILALDSYIYKEDLKVHSDGISFTIQGGFLDSLFHRITGATSIYGSIEITAGTVAFDDVEILPAQ
jgi:hypothetical protein